MIVHNDNCEGTHCTIPYGEVRLVPYSGEGNMILCYSCFRHEMAFRRAQAGALGIKPIAPKWEDLKVYDNSDCTLAG